MKPLTLEGLLKESHNDEMIVNSKCASQNQSEGGLRRSSDNIWFPLNLQVHSAPQHLHITNTTLAGAPGQLGLPQPADQLECCCHTDAASMWELDELCEDKIIRSLPMNNVCKTSHSSI